MPVKLRKNIIGITIKMSIAIETAEATGQSLLEKNSLQITLPIIKLSAPPKSDGITNSPIAGIKTKALPAKMPGKDKGSVIFKKVTIELAPKSVEASRRELSSFTRLA